MTGKPSLLRGLTIDLVVAQMVGLLSVILLVITQLHATVAELESRDMREVASDIAAHLHLEGRPVVDLPASASARFSPSYGRYAYAAHYWPRMRCRRRWRRSTIPPTISKRPTAPPCCGE